MLVKYNKTHLLTVHFITPDGPREMAFKPGVSDVDSDQFEFAKLHPAVSHLIENDEMVIMKAKSIKDFSEKVAAITIAKTVDEELLLKWQKTDKRKAVQAAIADQLKKIDPELDKADEKEVKAKTSKVEKD
jgi:hypothetical protein